MKKDSARPEPLAAEPAEPAKPAKTAKPAKPAEPANTAKPARPAKTAKTAKPAKPAKSASGRYVLRLYVAGLMPKSTLAIANMKKICEEHLQGQYQLEVIDLYQQPQLAQGDQIVAVPALIKKLPSPLRRVIGDMSDTERVLVGLDLRRKA